MVVASTAVRCSAAHCWLGLYSRGSHGDIISDVTGSYRVRDDWLFAARTTSCTVIYILNYTTHLCGGIKRYKCLTPDAMTIL